jgi:hypothetical protein
MKQKTLKKYLKLLQDIKVSGLSIKAYCEVYGIYAQSIYDYIYAARKQNKEESDMVSELLSLYNEITHRKNGEAVEIPQVVAEEDVETDYTADISYERDSEGKIRYYKYAIFRKGKAPLCGKLSREEMDTVYRLYSYYGDSLTQRVVSRYFTELSLIDFKRLLRVFNITKASAPFAPHMFEEKTEEELREIQLREKENSFLRKAEEDIIKNNEKLLKKYAQENIELKKKLEKADLPIAIPENIIPVTIERSPATNKDMNIYLSDIHLGAKLNSGALYKENIDYGLEEAKRRLKEALFKLKGFGQVDNLNIVLMGDNVDCSGVFGKTARLDHEMPESMDPREQANSYIELILWFIESIISSKFVGQQINVYSVPCGNHGGNFEYICNKALLAMINVKFPDIKTTLWEEFYGVFELGTHTFVCAHGKDDQFCKKGLPLNLDDKSKVMLYEWLNSKGLMQDNIHIVKGDLHSENTNACRRFTYRNVLSLFGASDYSNYNFSRNSYGVSYDLIIDNNLLSGTFENM